MNTGLVYGGIMILTIPFCIILIGIALSALPCTTCEAQEAMCAAARESNNIPYLAQKCDDDVECDLPANWLYINLHSKVLNKSMTYQPICTMNHNIDLDKLFNLTEQGEQHG